MGLIIIYSIEGVGNLGINVGVNCLDQFLHASGFFLIRNIGLALGGGRRGWVWDLARVSQRGILNHSCHLEGRKPTLPKPLKPCLVDNRFRKLLNICKTLVVPFVFASFKGCFEVDYLTWAKLRLFALANLSSMPSSRPSTSAIFFSINSQAFSED